MFIRHFRLLNKRGGYTSPINLLAIIVLLGLQLLPSTTAQLPPYISVEEFTVFAFKTTPNNSTNRNNNTIHFELRVANSNTRPAYNDPMNVTFYYEPFINGNNTIKQFIGNTTLGPLFQLKNDHDKRRRYFEARGVNWNNVNTFPLNFRVEVSSAVRYELSIAFKSKRFHYVIGANLKVDEQGNLIKRKHHRGISLSSKSGRDNNIGHVHKLVGLFLFILFFFHSW